MPNPSCLLFFPGTRPEMLPKAVASGAGLVCVDLEDAVAADAKSAARAAALELLSATDRPSHLVVRINHPEGEEGRRDLEALAAQDLADCPLTVMVPKVTSSVDLDPVRALRGGVAGGVDIIPVIETARGLAGVEEIATSSGVSAMIFGGLDLSVDLECALDWEALLYARSRSVHAARLAGVGLIDTPFFDVGDADGLRLEAERSHRLGFTAKAAIHPSQVEVIQRVFEPTDDEIDRARRIVDASQREGRGAFLIDGVMIDRPAIQAARRVLARFGAPEGGA